MTLLHQQKPDVHEGSIMTTTAVDRPALAATAAPAGDATRSKREVLEALSGLLLAMFVSILSATIVSNALPTIIADLHGSQTQYTWVVTATLLTTTASTPIWGKLADLFDKKLLVQIAIVIFVVSSAMAGLAQSMGWLIGWRAVQGIGAGGLQALAQVVIAALIPPRERGRYSGYLGAVLATATVSGPLIGGLLVDTSWLGWRWCFYVGVPIGVIALIVLQRTLHVPTVKRDVKLDYLGATLIAGGVSTLLIWISLAGSQFAWGSVTSLTLGALGIAALVAAVIVELRVPEPVVPMDLFRNRTVVLAVLGSIVLGLVMFGGSVFLGQYFQVARGYAPTEAGLLTLPLVGGLMIASTVSGQLISRYGRWKGFLVAGAVLTTAGLALLSTMDHTTSIPLLGVYLGVLGLGVGMSMQNLVSRRAEHRRRHRDRLGQLAGGVPAVDGRHDRGDGAGDRAQPPGERAAGRAGVGGLVRHLGPLAARRRRGRRGARRVRRRDRAGVPHRGDRLDPDAGGRGVHQGGPAADDGRPLPRGGPGGHALGGGAGSLPRMRPGRGPRSRGRPGDHVP